MKFSWTLFLCVFGISFASISIAQQESFQRDPSGAKNSKDSEFQWIAPRTHSEGIDLVFIANGALIKQKEKNKVPGRFCESQIFVSSAYSPGGFDNMPVCDDYARIIAAFPSKESAKVVILESSCSGSMCESQNYWISFINNRSVRTIKVGNFSRGTKERPLTLTFQITGDDLTGGKALNLDTGETNEFGDAVISSRYFVLPGGYVDARINKTWTAFVGKRPSDFFADTEARTAFLNVMTLEEFRKYRTILSGLGTSVVASGRFIVMSACMLHNCDDQFGAIVIDGFTNETYGFHISNSSQTFKFDSTTPLKGDIANAFIEELNDRDDVYFEFLDGLMKVRRKSK